MRYLPFVAVISTALACSGGVVAPRPYTPNPAFTQRFASPDGLFVVHYPPEFTARTTPSGVVQVFRMLDDGLDEPLSFLATSTPASNDVREFARVGQAAYAANLQDWSTLTTTDTTCVDVPCVEITGTWVLKGTTIYRRSVSFLDGGRGYLFDEMMPEARRAQDEPTLRAIVDAVEVTTDASTASPAR